MPLAPVNGLQLHYELRGNPTGPPLLLVMGLGMPAALWTEVFLRGLEEQGFHLLLFDNRDSGGSTRLAGVRGINPLHAITRALLRRKVPSPYDLDDMAADTAGLLDALGIASDRCLQQGSRNAYGRWSRSCLPAGIRSGGSPSVSVGR